MATINLRTSNPGCLALLAAPFLVLGIAGLLAAAGIIGPAPVVRSNPVLAATFVVVGGGVLLAAALGARRGRRVADRRAAHPDEPWLWRPDWAAGRADGRGDSPASLWFFAVVWNGIADTVVVLAWRSSRSAAPPWLLLFPLVGVLLLVLAIRASLRRARFGRTCLRLETLPAPLGRRLRGTIEVRLPAQRPHRVRLRLCRVHRTLASGKSNSTKDDLLWQAEHAVPAAELALGPRGAAAIPVDFEIPRDQPASDDRDRGNASVWYVAVHADVPGVDFDERYEVPVFATAESPSVEAWTAQERAEERAHPLPPPARPSVQAAPTPGGGTAFTFPAGRNKGMAATLTLVSLGLCGLEAAIVLGGGPVFARVLVGLLAALLLWGTVGAWFRRTRLVVEGGRLRYESSTLGIRTARSWSQGELRDVVSRLGAQSSGTAHYDVVVVEPSGLPRPVGEGLADQREAEWIVQQIREGLRPR